MREDVLYPPVIRPEPTGSDSVTWGEFVEAGLLRGYRKKKMSLQKMRPFIERTREETGVPYPLAHFKPLIIDRKELVYALQQETLLDPALYLVRVEGGQMLLAPPVQDFLERIEFTPSGAVSRLYPSGLRALVAIDPEVSFVYRRSREYAPNRWRSLLRLGSPLSKPL